MGGAFAKRAERVVLIGLDGAGKTTLLNTLSPGKVESSIFLSELKVQSIRCNGLSIDACDVGGSGKWMPILKHHYRGAAALIFLCDSSDRQRIDDAFQELANALFSGELDHVPLLVMANKADVPGALSSHKLADELGLCQLRSREWYIQECCAKSGRGVAECLKWLSHCLLRRPQVGRMPQTSESVAENLPAGSYCVLSPVRVWDDPRHRKTQFERGTGPCELQTLQADTIVTVVKIMDIRKHLTPNTVRFGMVENPLTGWIEMKSECLRKTHRIVTIHVSSSTSGCLLISCTSMSGQELAHFELPAEATLATLCTELIVQSGSQEDLRAILPDGTQLCDLDQNGWAADLISPLTG